MRPMLWGLAVFSAFLELVLMHGTVRRCRLDNGLHAIGSHAASAA